MIETVQATEALRRQVSAWRAEGLSVGFVPTMGNLHEGHLALVRDALRQSDRVVVSIFVNPMQFGANEDLDAYPRTLAEDQLKLEAVGAHLLFHPSVEAVYPEGEAACSAVLVPESLTDILCGASRPGHFRGVATVVAKLFNMVQPDCAVFGEKDLQQLRVIERMCRDLDFPVRIIGSPTLRETDGLARSSRNAYLTESERAVAPALHQALQGVAQAVAEDRGRIDEAVASAVVDLEARGFRVDYLEVRDRLTLALPEPSADRPLAVLGAAHLGRARLIDNVAVPA
ncbi:pantoate--beta-alanine ligase [Natronospira sp. AB-CW4]|uniref:Pantothenate synthetase n=1 Tax=Natronospira bacteriovora TaxID=3069753 RepID=A0ABU0W5U9_9GAMM|nr:pantoate--beta-alanine ligase [Natronospira sp. AB-CW4]MDQ2069402.1 pantoate--beta-alanine ligase [Natronospira sp. AB-CW4]